MCAQRLSCLLLLLLQFTILFSRPSIADQTEAPEPNQIIGCVRPQVEAVTQTDPALGTLSTSGPFHSPTTGYLRNGGYECGLVSDVNLKIAAGYTFVNPTPIDAMLDLMDCMYAKGCYVPNKGNYLREECMKRLCECNKQMVKEKISCEHSYKFDCEKIKKALESGGGATLSGLHGKQSGHAVQITAVDCKHNAGLYRDPNNPNTQTPFRVTDSGRIDAPGGTMDYSKVAATYVVQ